MVFKERCIQNTPFKTLDWVHRKCINDQPRPILFSKPAKSIQICVKYDTIMSIHCGNKTLEKIKEKKCQEIIT